MHIRAFGIRATIVLRDEFLSWEVLRDAKSMGTAGLEYTASNKNDHNIHQYFQSQPTRTLRTILLDGNKFQV